jgi:thioesterase domain-containing protein
VLNLYDVGRYLPSDRPFYGLQAAGVDGIRRPRETIEETAVDYLEEMRVLQPHGPYYLSGYCGGGIIAYEIAQRLLEMGESVSLLVLIDAYRPGLMLPHERFGLIKRALRVVDLGTFVRRTQAKIARDLTYAIRDIRVRYHLTTGNTVPHELRDFWLTTAFLRTVERYQLKPYRGKLTVLRARETNPKFTEAHPDLGWTNLASGGLELYEVPGDHRSLTREPHVRVLAGQLESCLRAAESSSQVTSTAPVVSTAAGSARGD